ncbi:2'-5' RNA ligase family protein [Acidihalobacter yilgarnensis]|uniref:2'-5' RNA ligase family protein n=1 Tax=Acidihalobacter yilgarnensis TaxID=2819280 RepID=UPI0038992D48
MTSLARQLSAQGLRPLYAHAFLPHVTLYLTNYLAGRLPQIEGRLRVLAAGVHPFDLRLGRIVATPSHWLLLKVMANRRMQRLADAVTRALDPLRVPHPPMSGWVKAYPEKREVFRRWGSPQFQPHLTLLTPADPARIAAFMRGPSGCFTGEGVRAVGIGIAGVDAHGQTHRVLVRIPFEP